MNARVKTSLQALAIARSTEADEAVLVVYLRALDDLDATLISRACERLAKQPRLEYQAALPEVGLIREEVAKIQREDTARDHQRRLAPHTRREEDPSTWIFCRDCEDSSYRQFRCDGFTNDTGSRDEHLRMVRCARRQNHQPHTYAERCHCYDTNPVIAKRRQRREEAAA